MRPLLIDMRAKLKIEQLTRYADKHRYTFDDLLDIKNGQLAPPGDNPEYALDIQNGYRIVYTIEQNTGGKIWFRHLSVSVDTPGALPSVEAVQLIMKEIGFKADLKVGNCVVNIEDTDPVNQAINVLEPLEWPY